MNKEEMIYHLRGRWKEVDAIQLQELRAMTLEEHWQKINAIFGFALSTKMNIKQDETEIEVFTRWAKLKTIYETR